MINKKILASIIIAMNIVAVSMSWASGAASNHSKYMKEAYQLYNKKNYQKAIERYKQASKERADAYYPHIMMSRVYKELGKYDLALDELEEAEKIVIRYHVDNKDKKNELHSINLKKGFANMERANYKEAVKNFESSSWKCDYKDYNKRAVSYAALSSALSKDGKKADALRSIVEAIELIPRYARYHATKAQILSDMGFKEDALKVCDKAIELKPGEIEYYEIKKAIKNSNKEAHD